MRSLAVKPKLASWPREKFTHDHIIAVVFLAADLQKENVAANDETASDRGYITSDPIGLDGGYNTYLYANANPLGLIDPDGLCPLMLNTGQFTGRPYSDKCFRNGRAARYITQQRTQIVATLVGKEGDCSCGKSTMTCIYDTTFYTWERHTPCGGGPFSPWKDEGPGPTRQLRVPFDCRTGKFFSPHFPITE